jgi:hypothetical protein
MTQETFSPRNFYKGWIAPYYLTFQLDKLRYSLIGYIWFDPSEGTAIRSPSNNLAYCCSQFPNPSLCYTGSNRSKS